LTLPQLYMIQLSNDHFISLLIINLGEVFMNKKILTGLVAGTVLLAASGLVMAKSPQHDQHNNKPCAQEVDFVMGWRDPNFAGMAQLTPDQQKIVKTILESAQTKAAPQLQLLQAKNVMLNAQLYQPKIDKNAINQLVQDMNTIRGQLLQQRIDTILQIKDKTGVTILL
jgi:Spy/CpxP family protein refolding chaperone